MASLRLTLNDLLIRVADQLSWTDGTVPTGDDLTATKDIIARGYRRFLYPVNQQTGQAHEWTFLKELYTVDTRSGVWKYQLPSTFSDVLTEPVFSDDEGYRQLIRKTPEQILDMRAGDSSTSVPYFYAIVPTGTNHTTGTFDEFWVWPEADGTYQLKFFIRVDPLKLDATTDYLVGGVRASEAILECCLAVAEQQEDGVAGIHTELADRLVQELIITDSKKTERTVLGNLYSESARTLEAHQNSTVDMLNVFPDRFE